MDVVNRMLNRKTETKYVAESPTNLVWENDIPGLGEWTIACPQISQGILDSSRLANYIQPVSHRTKLTLRFANTNTSAIGEPPTYVANVIPLDVTCYIFYGFVKSLKTYQGFTTNSGQSIVTNAAVATTAMANLLEVPSIGGAAPAFTTFSGDPVQVNYPMSDFVNMKVKKVRLHKPAGWVNTNVGSGGSAGEASSDGIHSKDVTLKFKAPSKLSYPKSTDIYPDNYAPVFAVGYVYHDAMTAPTAVAYGYGAVEYTAVNQLWYKDHQ